MILKSRVICYLCLFVFFQAEDGIRDLVRSRGLGDVYKRQVDRMREHTGERPNVDLASPDLRVSLRFARQRVTAVSYTHLTLPTSDLV